MDKGPCPLSLSFGHSTEEDIQGANRYMNRRSTSLIFREMQTKTTVTYCLIPVRMAFLKGQNTCQWGWKGKRMLVHCWWESTTTMENMEVPQKIKTRTTIWSRSPICGYLSKEIEIRISKRYLYSHTHCNTFHNGWDMETNVYWQMNDG